MNAQLSDFLQKVQKTASHYTRHGVVALRELQWRLIQPVSERPIFVVGCSRAGTTLVYKTLSESLQLGSLQRETHDFWIELHPLSQKQWRSHALGADDACKSDRDMVSRYFYSRTGARRFVDKNNQNGLCVPYLNALFPDAHFVYVKRSPGDNIHSLIEGWGKAEEFATWSSDLPAEVCVDGGRYRRWCFFLFDGWRDYTAKSIEEVCAAQYLAMNEAICHASEAIPSNRWSSISYEDLVRDPIAGFQGIFRACELDFTADIRSHCEAVLTKPYNAFSEIRLDKWKDQQNRERIERIMPVVATLARNLGYAV